METSQPPIQAQMETSQTPELEEEKTPAGKTALPLIGIIETLLFITDRPLSLKRIGELAKEKNLSVIESAVNELKENLQSRNSALRIFEIAGGFQMATKPEYASVIRKLFADKMTLKLSKAAHETLSIIAYRQPLTRAEIETIRGVDVIAALETLLEKKLIRVAGRKETIGRPLMYETTPEFLKHFGLKSLDELPPIDQFEISDPKETPASPEEMANPDKPLPPQPPTMAVETSLEPQESPEVSLEPSDLVQP